MTEFLKCPGCGKVFKAPVKDVNFFGRSFTEPGKGMVSCPYCNLIARHKRFLTVESSDTESIDFHNSESEN